MRKTRGFPAGVFGIVGSHSRLDHDQECYVAIGSFSPAAIIVTYYDSLEMLLPKSRAGQIRGVFFNAFLAGVITLVVYENIVKAEEVPAFFLKIAKIPTVPRVGRSGKFEDFFYKAEKHIPRIGRNSQSNDPLPLQNEQVPYSDLTKRRIDYSAKGQDAWSWQNFPLAIEGPKELWRTLALYAKDDSDDIDNEVWHKKKRSGTRPVTMQID